MGNDPKPTKQSRQAESRVRVDVGTVETAMEPMGPGAAAQADAGPVARALLPFLLRDDGWLRIVPQDDGATVYFKWKWTAGKHRDHYVMTVYPQFESGEALARLAAKVHAVDRGEQPPVKDHYFKG